MAVRCRESSQVSCHSVDMKSSELLAVGRESGVRLPTDRPGQWKYLEVRRRCSRREPLTGEPAGNSSHDDKCCGNRRRYGPPFPSKESASVCYRRCTRSNSYRNRVRIREASPGRLSLLGGPAIGETPHSTNEAVTPVLRKNSIWLPSDRDVGTCFFGFPTLENSRS